VAVWLSIGSRFAEVIAAVGPRPSGVEGIPVLAVVSEIWLNPAVNTESASDNDGTAGGGRICSL
jgi:hypothetical protein